MTLCKSRHPSGLQSYAVLLAGAVCLWSAPAFTQTAPERLSDKDVKTLIEQVDEGRDKFEGNLDGQFKGSTLRRPSGETKVEDALQDYQDNTKKLRDRFTSDYSASSEVALVLKQSTAINTFMLGSAPAMKGRSEWDRQVTNLKRLAASYGTTFPLPDGATPRRANDKEVRELRLVLSPLRLVEKSRKNPRAYRCPACGDHKAFGARQCRRCWRLSARK